MRHATQKIPLCRAHHTPSCVVDGNLACSMQELPPDVQLVCASATFPTAVLEFTERFMRDPERALHRHETLSLRGIRQFYVAVEREGEMAHMHVQWMCFF